MNTDEKRSEEDCRLWDAQQQDDEKNRENTRENDCALKPETITYQLRKRKIRKQLEFVNKKKVDHSSFKKRGKRDGSVESTLADGAKSTVDDKEELAGKDTYTNEAVIVGRDLTTKELSISCDESKTKKCKKEKEETTREIKQKTIDYDQIEQNMQDEKEDELSDEKTSTCNGATTARKEEKEKEGKDLEHMIMNVDMYKEFIEYKVRNNERLSEVEAKLDKVCVEVEAKLDKVCVENILLKAEIVRLNEEIKKLIKKGVSRELGMNRKSSEESARIGVGKKTEKCVNAKCDNSNLMTNKERIEEGEERGRKITISREYFKTIPDALSKSELEWEKAERNARKRNILITGIKTVGRGIKEEIRETVRKYMGMDIYIKEIRSVGGGNLVELDSFHHKLEIMKNKSRLSEIKIWIEDDLTERERQVQNWLHQVAKEEKEGGIDTKVGYQKIKINGIWYYWNEIKGQIQKASYVGLYQGWPK